MGGSVAGKRQPGLWRRAQATRLLIARNCYNTPSPLAGILNGLAGWARSSGDPASTASGVAAGKGSDCRGSVACRRQVGWPSQAFEAPTFLLRFTALVVRHKAADDMRQTRRRYLP